MFFCYQIIQKGCRAQWWGSFLAQSRRNDHLWLLKTSPAFNNFVLWSFTISFLVSAFRCQRLFLWFVWQTKGQGCPSISNSDGMARAVEDDSANSLPAIFGLQLHPREWSFLHLSNCLTLSISALYRMKHIKWPWKWRMLLERRTERGGEELRLWKGRKMTSFWMNSYALYHSLPFFSNFNGEFSNHILQFCVIRCVV